MKPEARQAGLLVQEVGDEVVVYDQEHHVMHCLDLTTARIWRHCDGQKTVAEIVRLLQDELNHPSDDELVWLALEQLEEASLLREKLTRLPDVASDSASRRDVLRRGSLALLAPFITSILAPTPAAASSPCTPLQSCGCGQQCFQQCVSDCVADCGIGEGFLGCQTRCLSFCNNACPPCS